MDVQPDRGPWIRAAIARYEGALVRYAAHLTGNVESARDVVQDAFVRLCEQSPTDIDNVGAWLYRVCRNRALDLRRKDRPMRNTSDARLSSCATNEPSPSALAEQRQSLSRLLALLDGLPEKQQEVVRLKLQQGLSYREIAELTGLSTGYVGYLMHFAVKTLREQLTVEPHRARSAQ